MSAAAAEKPDLTPRNRIGRYLYADGWLAKMTFEGGREFSIVIAGAYDAGIIGSEHNGIAILDENNGRVLADQILQQSSGWYGPSEAQIAEFDRVRTMDWPAFTGYLREQKTFRGGMADVSWPKPQEFQPIADRTIFPDSAKPAENPYKMPLTGRREIIDFLKSHTVHHVDGPYSSWSLAWNIKVGGSFNSTGRFDAEKHPELAKEFTPDPAFDQRWTDHVDKDEYLFNEAADNALRQYREGSYSLWEGSEDGAYGFQTTGRSGGWLILTKFADHEGRDMQWQDAKHLEGWLDGLEDAELVHLYKLVGQVDADVARRGDEMEYQYAFLRQGIEETWAAEAAAKP